MEFRKLLGLVAFVPALCGAACSSTTEEDAADEGGGGESALVSEEGPVDVPGSATEVWSVTHKWSDINAATSKTYEESYADWVKGLRRVRGFRYGETLHFETPEGAAYQKDLDAPTLECADTALFARVAYASLNHLPFFVKSGDLFAGHFGIIKKDGSRHSLGSNFKSKPDFEGRWNQGDTWPSDAALRAKHIDGYKSGDETFVETSPGTKGGDGAWFDEFFLNKRVGWFLLSLVDLFGSTNLAQEGNMFHIKPEATRPGDALLHRHGKYAPIGHTLFVYQSRTTGPNRMQIEIVSGSMPARQASWEPWTQSRNYFTSNEGGGPKTVNECRTDYSLNWENQTQCRKELETITKDAAAACPAGYEKQSWDDTKCVKYAVIPAESTDLRKMGGGIRRFRTAVKQNGRWMNIVPSNVRDIYIADTDLEAIGARPAQFDQLLALGSPEERKTAAVAAIASYRDYIKNAPSTCSKRTAREDAFAELYDAYSALGQYDHAKIDGDHRTLEDYVFAELDYDTSKTCCWNSTKREHFDTVMAWAKDVMDKGAANGTCVAPPVFKAQGDGDGYAAVRAFATAHNMPFPSAWTEDEACKAKAVTEDSLTPRAKETKFCK